MELEAATAEQPRWSVSSGDGEVVWSGGPIARVSAETFAFTARVPEEPDTVELTLVETYDDGESAPFPIRMTVVGSAAATGGGSDVLGAAALVVALLALGLATLALLVAQRAGRRRSET